jgi:hypothetical protein
MATVYLNRSDSEFWDMTFRQLVCLIEQWKEIEKSRDVMRKYIADGGDPKMIGVSEKKIREAQADMGEAMW